MNRIHRNLVYAVIFVLMFFAIAIEGNRIYSIKQKVNAWTLFYNEACPHCQNVEAFIKEHKLNERFLITKRDVGADQYANIQTLSAYARHCGINGQTVMLPFLWNGEQCLMGDKTIIKYFTEQMNEEL